tara:strand:- start:56 stop:772 length:717 start_codon:yes stop_codon:yes gene_type:complete
MGKTLLFLFLITNISVITAQSLIVSGSNSVIYNDTTALGFDTLDLCLTTHSYLTVKNVSNESKDIICAKNVISEPAGMSNYFCWGGLCYGSGTIISTSFLTLQAGKSDTVSFGGYFDAYCDQQIGIIEYCFYPALDPNDKSCFTITYNGKATSINDYTLATNIGNFYPNPASEMAYFTFNGNAETLKLIDILGNKVKEISLSQERIQKLDLSGMNKGIYFGNLMVNGEVVSVKKLIVK